MFYNDTTQIFTFIQQTLKTYFIGILGMYEQQLIKCAIKEFTSFICMFNLLSNPQINEKCKSGNRHNMTMLPNTHYYVSMLCFMLICYALGCV